jgi:hypothetical protein
MARRILKLSAALLAVAAVPFGAAQARGGVGVGLSFNVPLGPAPYYYAPPPPVYYYPPPPVVYAPPAPVYAPPAPVSAAPQQHCREYQSESSVGGVPSTIYGTACLQPGRHLAHRPLRIAR